MDVIVVNGPAGVGKTTVARALASRSRNGICVHGDALREFVVTRGPARPRGLAYAGCARLTELYLEAGFERVVVEFVFPDRPSVDLFGEQLSARTEFQLLTLWAPLGVVQDREARRAGRARIGDLVLSSWHSIHRNLADLGTTVDATRGVEDVVAQIERLLAS